MEPEVFFNVQQGPYWDWRVAMDLFLGGAGVGAFLFGIALDEVFKGRYRRICQTAAYLAPFLILVGLGFLLLKLGRPLHLPLSYVTFAPKSPLWWGGIFQPLLVIGAILYALKWHKAQEQPAAQDPARRRLGLALVPLAVIVGTYHGLLLEVMTARPLWNTGPTVVAAILGFATTGIAAVMLTHLLRMKLAGRLADEEHVRIFLDDMIWTRHVLVSTLVLQLATLFFWWLSLNYGALQDKQALAAANEAFGTTFWRMGIGVGLVLPLILGAYAVWREKTPDQGLQLAVIGLTSAFILVGGYYFRLAVVLAGQVELPISSLS